MLNLLHQATELKYDNEVEMHQKGTGARDGRQGIAGVRMAHEEVEVGPCSQRPGEGQGFSYSA